MKIIIIFVCIFFSGALLQCGTVTFTNANVTQPVILGKVARIGGQATTFNGGREFKAEVSSAAKVESGGGVNTGHHSETAGSNAADAGILTVLEKPEEQVRIDSMDTGTYVLFLILWGYGKSYVEAKGHVQ